MRCDVDDVRTELIGIIGEEFTVAGIENTVIQPTESGDGTVAPAQMMVPISPDRFGRTPHIHVYFLPVLDDPPVVQFMVPLEYDIVATHAADLARFLALVNSNLPLTGFEMNESMAMIVFRHTQAVSTAPLDPGVIAWPLTMIRYAVEAYGALIEVVANGGEYDAAATAFAAAFHELNAPG
jgi:hypothetical protein